jgi:hypothetical protein
MPLFVSLRGQSMRCPECAYQGPRDWELPQQVWINAMLWVLLAPFSHMVCKETIAGQRVVGPLYPLMHVNMHCRAVDGLQPHDVHQATNTVSSG